MRNRTAQSRAADPEIAIAEMAHRRDNDGQARQSFQVAAAREAIEAALSFAGRAGAISHLVGQTVAPGHSRRGRRPYEIDHQAGAEPIMDEVHAGMDAALCSVPWMGVFTFGEQGVPTGGRAKHGKLMISCTVLGG